MYKNKQYNGRGFNAGLVWLIAFLGLAIWAAVIAGADYHISSSVNQIFDLLRTLGI